MDRVTLYPGVLQGQFMVPPSKSIAHRAMICAALAAGESIIAPVDASRDMLATCNGLEALGAEAKWLGDGGRKSEIDPRGTGLRVAGKRGTSRLMPEIDCDESGSTLRFFIPIALALSGGGRFLGRGLLGKRPLGPYEAIFDQCGIVANRGQICTEGMLDLTLHGALRPGDYVIPGDVSSQFTTGLLLGLSLLDGVSTISFSTPLESRAYVELTLQVMEAFGATASWAGDNLRVEGPSVYNPRTYTVEGDYSQGAVFLCAAALQAARGQGNTITVTGLSMGSRQGDKAVLDYLRQMGARPMEAQGAIAFEDAKLHGITIDGGQCPDILPMLALTMALSQGEGCIANCGRLRIKECDRLSATVSILSQLGANICQEGDTMAIRGVETLQGGCRVSCCNDHRMAMMVAIAALFAREPVTLEGPEAVAKSWPGYWNAYEKLGGCVK